MGKMLTKTLDLLTKPNIDPITKSIIPRQVNFVGGTLAVGGIALVAGGNEVLKERNASKKGRVSYMDGPARMTNSYTSGVVQDMHRIANGNYGVFADMSSEVVETYNPAGKILDDYGANDKLISALYHMGG